MPYKFETDKMRVPKILDRRRKLSDSDKERIRHLHKQGTAIRAIARLYDGICSRSLIQFVIFPERDRRRKDIVSKGKHWKRYYTKEKNTAYIKKHRRYKQRIKDELV